jgi:hypothetical protein
VICASTRLPSRPRKSGAVFEEEEVMIASEPVCRGRRNWDWRWQRSRSHLRTRPGYWAFCSTDRFML